ncbi:hydroxyacid dehydrogenase [Myceligenerans pegani]|uniref:Hydroxyacid dehydrogenase n=1 Tax=Myceligenerans pegani TaxID=2776917 RepID=A0ABR9N6K4_9MICO|nr:hydroxyacid dehydrogenase [Myceligenerans sp. TRM 65318]MBE1879025.1 hydroxyacid dehydrogenase [Myceligenerans sp. TRM 65318]MBE3021296.1 hydroxyacid dehydrogenase [Myceligenerans sp. TRM 65318]
MTTPHGTPAGRRPRVALAMRPAALADDLFAGLWPELDSLADLTPGVVTEWDGDAVAVLADTEVLLTGWGCPRVTRDLLARAPRLRAVIHAGGGAAAVVDAEAAAERGIELSDAGDKNAVPVAEYTFAMIVLAGKRARYAERLYRDRRAFIDREAELRDTGGYGRVVGLVGASRIGRRVALLLAGTDLDVLVHDPYLSAAHAAALGVRRCDLAELMSASDIVSLHAPVTSQTVGMVDAAMLGRMRDGATLINTARGDLVDHVALLEHLRPGRIDAVLDVTVPEPLPPDHELWSLPNVVLTPHIAGATGNELARLGRHLLDELRRLRDGVPPAAADPAARAVAGSAPTGRQGR